jgi:hypothetical protein
MRFLPTDRKLWLAFGVIFVVLLPIDLLGWSESKHRWFILTTLLASIFNGAIGLGVYFDLYWELQPTCLFEKRLLRQRRVPYADIQTVKPHMPNWNSGYFKLEYDSHRPNSRPGRLYLNPVDREGFFSALHERAPQANLELIKPFNAVATVLDR